MSKKIKFGNIERLEMMEENCGVSLDGVYAEYERISGNDQRISVLGEVQSVGGTTIKDNIKLVMTAFNEDGNVIATTYTYFLAHKFFGISSFDLHEDVIEKPVKIRIYPEIM